MVCSVEKGRTLYPSWCWYLLGCQSHRIRRTNRNLMWWILTRTSSEKKLKYAPVSQLKQQPYLNSLAGRPFRWILAMLNTFFLLSEYTTGIVTVLILQPEASSRLPSSPMRQVQWWWDTTLCTGSVLVKVIARLKQEMLKANAAATVVKGYHTLHWGSAGEGHSSAQTRTARSSNCCKQPSLCR